jgi:hypothetical protein
VVHLLVNDLEKKKIIRRRPKACRPKRAAAERGALFIRRPPRT